MKDTIVYKLKEKSGNHRSNLDSISNTKASATKEPKNSKKDTKAQENSVYMDGNPSIDSNIHIKHIEAEKPVVNVEDIQIIKPMPIKNTLKLIFLREETAKPTQSTPCEAGFMQLNNLYTESTGNTRLIGYSAFAEYKNPIKQTIQREENTRDQATPYDNYYLQPDSHSIEILERALIEENTRDQSTPYDNYYVQPDDGRLWNRHKMIGYSLVFCCILVFLVFVICKNNSSLNIPNAEDSLNGYLSMDSQLLV
ncbi:uncharacterized protein NESG_01989 [Nematocida ausubeli]|uniref:Uncharacterized protein n=1 Tax=Nematocida ausubeli (strain ATCC PRA-371 / ERTm2) TaxID=1913371 RepID=A0A086IZA2_NEMA1|nr:uncharacterized protein NESG_01989 [Nematocida ausubeli]KFG25220.1 hypothetical protein NESG_01989 [Nematocida ausubeli]